MVLIHSVLNDCGIEVEIMVKRFLCLGWALLVWGIGKPLALAGETRDEALPAKSETVIKAENKNDYWRPWDLGLRSTHFQMSSRQGYGTLIA